MAPYFVVFSQIPVIPGWEWETYGGKKNKKLSFFLKYLISTPQNRQGCQKIREVREAAIV